MTIQEARNALESLGRRINSSIYIDTPGVWMHSHCDWKPEATQWRVYVYPIGKAYYAATLEGAVRAAIADNTRQETEIEPIQTTADQVEALATA